MNTHIEKQYAIKEIKSDKEKALFVLRDGFEVFGSNVIEGETEAECYSKLNQDLKYISDGVAYYPWLKSQFAHVYPRLPLSWLRLICYTHKPLKKYALFTMDDRVYHIRSGKDFTRIFLGRYKEFVGRNAKHESVASLLELTTKFKYKLGAFYSRFIRLVTPTKGGYKAYLKDGYLSLQLSDDLETARPYIVSETLEGLHKAVLKYAPIPFKVIGGRREVVSDLSAELIEKSRSYYERQYPNHFARCQRVVWCKSGVYLELKEPYRSYYRTKNPFKGEKKACIPRGVCLKFLGAQWITEKGLKSMALLNSDLYRSMIGAQSVFVKRIGQFFNLQNVEDLNNAFYFVELRDGFSSMYFGKPMACCFFTDLEDVCAFCAKQYIQERT